MSQMPKVITSGVAVMDPNRSTNSIPNTLKVNADGSIDVNATSSASTASTMTASQVTVPATANGILILASNANRKGAIISNPGSATVYIQQGATGVTTSNGFAIPAGSSFNIDSPLYTGAIYGIVATGTQVVTVCEMT